MSTINDAVAKALNNQRSRPRYAYIAPLRSQAKKVSWEYCKEYTEGLHAKKPSESELVVSIRTPYNDKATLELYGADGPNAEAMRGNYFDGVVVDEYGDMRPSILEKIILPTLTDRQGWVVLIGTYKGKNHFYRTMRNYQGYDLPYEVDPVEHAREHFTMVLRADQSGIIPEPELIRLRRSMDTESYRQEFLCDPNAAVKGTYYAEKINELEDSGQIFSDEAAYDIELPVESVMDVGRTDGFACWMWQKRPGGIALIDYFEMVGADPEKVFAELDKRPYRYRKLWLPHDAKAKTFQSKRSTIEQFLEKYGPDIVSLVPELGKQDGITAVRKILPMCYFDRKTSDGVEALRAYARKFDEITKSYSDDAVHNWASHPSDAFRYLAIVAQSLVVEDVERPKIVIPRGPTTRETLEQMFQERERRMTILRRR